MRWKSHVRFGGRAGETDQAKARHCAPARPDTLEWSRCGEFRLVHVSGLYRAQTLGCQYDRPLDDRRAKRSNLHGILQLGVLSMRKPALCTLLNQYRQDVLDAERALWSHGWHG